MPVIIAWPSQLPSMWSSGISTKPMAPPSAPTSAIMAVSAQSQDLRNSTSSQIWPMTSRASWMAMLITAVISRCISSRPTTKLSRNRTMANSAAISSNPTWGKKKAMMRSIAIATSSEAKMTIELTFICRNSSALVSV